MSIARRSLLQAAFPAAFAQQPEKLAVLTFDDAPKSHRTFVAPYLKELGFNATFFVSHRWMPDEARFMSWRDIAEIHAMGFEIGNHSWTHANFGMPREAARLAGELALVENELSRVNVPKPVSFAWPGNGFGPESLAILENAGYKYARRGISPEQPYGTLNVGPVYDPVRYDKLLIPTTGDAYPAWTPDHFENVLAAWRPGKIVVLQFHGVPDEAHPWVHTPPEMFRRYMERLKAAGFRTLALRDLGDRAHAIPADTMRGTRHPAPKDGRLILPAEVAATRQDARWLDIIRAHGYSADEIFRVYGQPLHLRAEPQPKAPLLLPYPGGRHPRAGFFEGAIDPMRGTKASYFLPGGGYAVVDLPEAIFSNLGLTFLAHTHIPTIWNGDNVVIENVDWTRGADGSLRSHWKLPNGIEFGATATAGERLEMSLWLINGAKELLTGLRTQICVMLARAAGFEAQTNGNKRFGKSAAAVRHADGQWLITEWDRAGRTWGNPRCPCMHADPVFPDCPPGERVEVKGRLWLADSLDGFA
ncbi:MAG: polysaccharide deacetylase family protein [Bryobacteraceae bacterium]